MAIRKLGYTVYLDGIDPAARQFGGIQGEHNATELNFNLCDEIYDSVMSQAEGKKAIYRFEGFDCLGSMRATEPLPLIKNMTYSLENWLTKEGGTIRVHLVISVADGDDTVMDIFTFPALLQLKENPKGEIKEPEDYENIPTLAYRAGVYAAQAENAANKSEDMAAAAETAQQKTEEAMLALEAGSVIIFQGGNASSRFAVDVVVDDAISDVSTNPVENKAVKKFVEANLRVGAAAMKAADKNALDIKEMQEEADERDETIKKLENRVNLESAGTSGDFYYKKYSNGEAKCLGRVNFEGSVLSEYGKAYYNGNLIYVSLPKDLFVKKPLIFPSAIALDAQLYQIAIGSASAERFSFYVESDRSLNTGKCECCFEIFGKWKEEE